MSECPLCGWDVTEEKYMKNGQWSLGGLDIETADYVCADWDSQNLTLYFHSEEDQPAERSSNDENSDAPEEWGDNEWEEAMREAAAKAEISMTKGTVTTKTIDDKEYYYLQWRDGEQVKSQYVGPVDPA